MKQNAESRIIGIIIIIAICFSTVHWEHIELSDIFIIFFAAVAFIYGLLNLIHHHRNQ